MRIVMPAFSCVFVALAAGQYASIRRHVLILSMVGWSASWAGLAAPALGGESIGWRGDGSGIHPDADPPLRWHRTSEALKGLRFRSGPPGGGEPSGQPMPDGVIREWLILGPIPAKKGPDGGLIDELLAEDQTRLAAAEGRELAGVKWSVLKTDTAFIDCARLYGAYGKKPDQVAYAHADLYSPAEADLVLRVMHTAAVHVWLDGKTTHKFDLKDLNYSPQAVKLKKGWSRLLLRITPQHTSEQEIVLPWYASVAFEAAPEKAEYDQQNIAWKTLLPAGEGYGGPIVVGGRVYLLSEPADLVCLDAATGKVLFVRSSNYDGLATEEERKAHAEVFREIDPLAARLEEFNRSIAGDVPPEPDGEDGRFVYKEKIDLEKKLYALMRKVDGKKYSRPRAGDIGYAGLTPISDGRRIYSWFASGVTCCHGLDGALIWRRLDNEGSSLQEHGYSSSPLLADGKVIVFMNRLMAFDAARGDRLWATESRDYWGNRFHGSLAAARVAGVPLCVLPNGQIVRLSDGRIVRDKGPEFIGLPDEIPTPVVAGNTVYRLSTYNRFYRLTLPEEMSDPLKVESVRELKIDVSRYPTYYMTWHLASPLVHDGLAYLVNNTGVLTVVDVERWEVVYEKLLDLDQFQTAHEGAGRGIGIGPALAGGRIYLAGNTGSTLVIRPGRRYEPLAKNRIESVFFRYYALRHERFVANPAFDGMRIFLRGERYLYCIAGQ